jgi:glycosyltransferase involved in cell wall biosynthesis
VTPRVLVRIARVIAIAFAGALIRVARRMLRRPPRIWHGFTPVHSTAWMVDADRKAGFPSMSVVMNTRASRRYALVRAEDFDRVFEEGGVRWDDVHWLALEHLLWHGDIWNAYFDCLFFHHDDRRKNALAFRLIRLAGIRILVQLHGSDLLALGMYESRYGWPERAQLDYPQWDLAAQRDVVRTRIDLFHRYAHFILCGDALYEPVLPRWDASFHTVPVDVDKLRPSGGTIANDVPLIIHAPNHRHLKGTLELLATLDRLKARGFAFELRLIEGVPRHEALQLYARADIVADQFVMGAFGIFALEGLALGKPVLTYLDDAHLGRSIYNHPLVNTNLDNMAEVLAALLAVPELRARIGAASRESVVKYQSVDVLAEAWSRIYEHMWWRKPLALESLRLFDPQRGTRALTEDPREAEFWPVPVEDLLPRIREAIARAT